MNPTEQAPSTPEQTLLLKLDEYVAGQLNPNTNQQWQRKLVAVLSALRKSADENSQKLQQGDQSELPLLVKSLTSELVSYDPEVYRFLTQLFEGMKSRYPNMLGFILLGGFAHAGARVAHQVNREMTDVDLGVVITPGFSQAQSRQLVSELNQELERHMGMYLCDELNPINFQFLSQNQHEWEAQLLEFLENPGKLPQQFFAAQKLIMLFQPVIPVEVGSDLQSEFLKAFEQVTRFVLKQPHGPDIILTLVKNLMVAWRSYHLIKLKHFGLEISDEAPPLAKKAYQLSNESAQRMQAGLLLRLYYSICKAVGQVE